MSDGSGDRLTGTYHHPVLNAGKPLVVLVHGMSGCEGSAYVLYSARHFLAAGFPVLRLNLRGAGPAGPLCVERYHAGRTSDFAAVLDSLPADRAANGVVAVGYSLGGNMILKYLGERGDDNRLSAAVSISAPVDLGEASDRMLRPRNRIYRKFLVQELARETLDGKQPDRGPGIDTLKACESVREFDEIYTAPMNGYADVQAYYDDCSARYYTAAIRTPVLVIHAPNDPWIPIGCYADTIAARNPALTLCLEHNGGHVGFHGIGSAVAWHDRAAVKWFGTVTG